MPLCRVTWWFTSFWVCEHTRVEAEGRGGRVREYYEIYVITETGKMEAVTKLIAGPASILPSNIVTLVLARLNHQQVFSSSHFSYALLLIKAQTKDIDVAIREHLAYKSLLEAHDCFNAWNAHHISPPEQPPRPVGYLSFRFVLTK
jgi:hypothetical protein